MLPPLGHLDAYIAAVHALPLLSADEEQRLARQLRDQGDLAAAGRLVLSHLRLVVSVSRQYLGYGLPHGDLIQEGNVGLMKAVRRFDPDQGVRLVSYALHWIKAEIHEFVLRNWRLVKVATTKAQRKLFFNLRSLKQALRGRDGADDAGRGTLSAAEVAAVAEQLRVKPDEVLDMEARLAAHDLAIDPLRDEDEATSPVLQLADERDEPTRRLERLDHERLAGPALQAALASLDARSRRIVEARWLEVRDDGGGGRTLHELAEEFGVSAERIRQVEAAAMKKLRATLQAA